MDFSTGYNGIYGFNFEYSYPRQPSPYSPRLVIMTYFDNGEREADSFTISWNEELRVFERIRLP
jgi:hypothetical protein